MGIIYPYISDELYLDLSFSFKNIKFIYPWDTKKEKEI